MADIVTYEQVEALAVQLPPVDQQKLAARLLAQCSGSAQSVRPGRKWSEIAGIAPKLLGSEDAQAWVSRTRRESDERREQFTRPHS
jgi:hypothetical protein